jgi:ABC-type nitrate/sulfonate/bicarbonate transport system substrate-binding protein
MVTQRLSRRSAVFILLPVLFIGASSGTRLRSAAIAAAATPQIPQVTVVFGHEPYFDHTQASIALKKGWFKDVGITISPDNKGLVVQGDDAISFLASGRLDVVSGSAQLFMPAVKRLPSYKIFSFADIFQGYALMAQPNAGYKSYQELVKSGMPSGQAFKTTIGQMKGKTFAFPSEAAIKGFITLVLQRGGLTLSDVHTTVAPDSQTTSLMISKRADFQVGGVPSRLTLQSQGFKPIVTSGDLAAAAKPSADSEELRAIFHDGWVATDKWLAANHNTALRLLSVSFRVNQFIHDHPVEALAIHTPFLNSVAGTHFDNKIGAVVYSSLDPFRTFDQQRAWFLDDKNPLNEKYVIGTYIKLYQQQGIFPGGQYKYTDFSVAGQFYREMLQLKQSAQNSIAQALSGPKAHKADVQSLVRKAQTYLADFDFLDASQFAKAAAQASKA